MLKFLAQETNAFVLYHVRELKSLSKPAFIRWQGKQFPNIMAALVILSSIFARTTYVLFFCELVTVITSNLADNIDPHVVVRVYKNYFSALFIFQRVSINTLFTCSELRMTTKITEIKQYC